MVDYLLKVLVLVVSSFFVIYNYYFVYDVHKENFDWYIPYFLIIWVIYGVYKLIQVTISSKKVSFTPFSILNYFLIHLLVLCIIFFSLNDWAIGWWFILFFKILSYSFFPALIIFISTAFWKKIISLSNLSIFQDKKNNILSFVASVWIWFFSFLFLLDTIWILGFYNLYAVFLILILFWILSYKQILELFDSCFSYNIEFDFEEGNYMKLISTEIFFIVSTLILSVSLINIVRPFPIWWDDLWAYMNYPHLMAEAWSILSLGWMQAWQTFTGIGYMLNSTTQAFFFNIVWWFLSFISIVLITWDLLKSQKKTFLNIPLLVWTIFISMPMIVFQQAKDMKLDAWLFFVSIISLYLLFKYYLIKESPSKPLIQQIKSHIPSPLRRGLGWGLLNLEKIIIFLLIWILAWFAFTIKFTSLLLISWLIWIISFTRLWLSWFLAYLSFYFAIFTKLNLWKHMHVVFNPDKISNFENIFSLLALIAWAWFLTYSLSKNKEKIKIFFCELLIFLLWVIIAILPWIWRNVYVSYPDISVWTILWWKTEKFDYDYTSIHTKEKIEEIKNAKESIAISSSWTTNNEDLWRYFGYEGWINNYLKLPWNLTMQKNQWWEFTDIWFLYLALLPLILLFLPFKNKNYAYWVLAFFIFWILIVFSTWLTSLMSLITIPFWYSIILLWFLIPTIFFLYTLKDTNKNYLFKLNLIFASFYTFLWTISAFWIVWYWITMYFSFLLMIALWIHYLSSYDNNDWKEEKLSKLYWSIIVLLIIFIYLIFSVFPHSFNNLKGASYAEYKLWDITMAESSYLYHPEYLKILFELNIAEDKKSEFILNTINSKAINGSIKQLKWENNISLTVEILKKYQTQANIPKELVIQARKSLQDIYSWISNPEEKYKNKVWIYRIWTFLKYHISENNNRLLEDSLIFNFNDYIYDKDPDKTVENLDKLWLKYLLVDLNAATIDRDSRHNLTKRYERLLSTFVSDKLELVETDSICLKIWLDDYKTTKDIDRYMNLAGVNYESYKDWKTINRRDKAITCYKYINELVKQDLISKNFRYKICR